MTRCGLGMSPMSGLGSDSRNPMNAPVASLTVEQEVGELTFNVAFKSKQFPAQFLRRDHDGVFGREPRLGRLLHKPVRICRFLTQRDDSSFEDFAFPDHH